MSQRRKGREFALQVLYAMDMGGGLLPEAVDGVLRDNPVLPEAKAYGIRLAEKVVAERDALEKEIRAAASNWDLDRMAVVDRIVILCSAAEILYFADVPPKASISEAVDIAKKFSTAESSRFVNGVLDSIVHKHEGHQPKKPREVNWKGGEEL